MLLLWALLLGLLIGFLRHGRLANLAKLKLKGLWLILVALIIQLLIFPLGHGASLVQVGTPYLHLLSYLALLTFIGFNWHYFGILLMGIGLALNTLVISINGGYMPASIPALRHAGLNQVAGILEQDLHHGNTVLMSADTKLNFLGDIFSVPASVPLATAFSIGDSLLALGTILFLACEMPRTRR